MDSSGSVASVPLKRRSSSITSLSDSSFSKKTKLSPTLTSEDESLTIASLPLDIAAEATSLSDSMQVSQKANFSNLHDDILTEILLLVLPNNGGIQNKNRGEPSPLSIIDPYYNQGRLHHESRWSKYNVDPDGKEDPHLRDRLVVGQENIPLGVLRTNKNTYQVASEVFYGRNYFRFNNAEICRWWINHIGPQFQRIRFLAVILDTGFHKDHKNHAHLSLCYEQQWLPVLNKICQLHQLDAFRVFFKKWKPLEHDLKYTVDEKATLQLGRMLVLGKLQQFRGIPHAKIANEPYYEEFISKKDTQQLSMLMAQKPNPMPKAVQPSLWDTYKAKAIKEYEEKQAKAYNQVARESLIATRRSAKTGEKEGKKKTYVTTALTMKDTKRDPKKADQDARYSKLQDRINEKARARASISECVKSTGGDKVESKSEFHGAPVTEDDVWLQMGWYPSD